jgi:hypothetical protein
MRNFFTEPDIWAGGKAVPLEELAVAFEKAMMEGHWSESCISETVCCTA